jgi:formylglycine-generating enzyme required for sulfatase activity
MQFGTKDEYELVLGAVPLQQLHVPAFYINAHEVTNKQYKLCVTHGDCTVPLDQTRYKARYMENHPVVYVTLFQANTFCQWIGQRLLTEVEWERAVRGSDGLNWPWETNEPPLPHLVNMPAPETSDPNGGTQPAISYTAGRSPDGVYNLIGNVWEWTSSYVYQGGDYDPTQYWDGDQDDYNGTLRYATRGGGWANKISFVAQSNPNYGTDVRQDLGFRCGADAE